MRSSVIILVRGSDARTWENAALATIVLATACAVSALKPTASALAVSTLALAALALAATGFRAETAQAGAVCAGTRTTGHDKPPRAFSRGGTAPVAKGSLGSDVLHAGVKPSASLSDK